jgi:tetraacyldisaccharide 4'-kinase
MMFFKPKFWDNKINIAAISLLPLSLILLVIIFIKKVFTRERKFKIPIICVGNIYVGGTGKTPVSILLANKLSGQKRNPVILRKYYKIHKDEHDFIKNKFKNLILSKNRIIGLSEAEKTEFDTAILDDGFQDVSFTKDISIICFNQNQLIGNGLVLPAGPLRERLSSLKKADIVIINGEKDKIFEDKILKINNNLKIFYSFYKPINIDEFKNKRLLAIAGIGNPENFFDLLKKNNLNIEKKLIFPDHYNFSKKEIKKIIEQSKKDKLKIIMTEKDFYKIKNYSLNDIKYLKVEVKIRSEEKLFDRINKIYD